MAKLTHLPIKGVNLEKIGGSALFGERIHPIFKTKTFHEGVDFGAPSGTKVYAVADGTVEVSKMQNNKRGYGEYVVIDHKDEMSIYAHLSVRNVKLKQKVKAGDVIGLVGSTGDSTGPHLHFGLCKNFSASNRGWTDPLPRLKAIGEDDEVITKTKIEINGKIKEVDTIKKDGFNFIKLRDLTDAIFVDYDESKKLPIVKSK